MQRYTLGVVDYVLFGAFMCISTGVGIYYAIVGKLKTNVDKEKATEDYLMGGRSMPFLPVVLSLVTTFMSGITLFGIPAEIYEHGAVLMLQYLTMPLAILLLGYIFVPIFYNLGSTSIYEYLEIRFHSVFLRRICAAMFVVNTIMLMGVVIYAPAVALSGVTNIDTWILILLVGVSSTLYTTLGGLKAVVWTDALQAGVMYAGTAIIVVKGTMEYMSIWITLSDSLLTWLSFYGLNQMALQRYCSVSTLSGAKRIVKHTAPLYLLFSLITWYIGFTVLAYFYDCNPLETGEVKKYDQLMVTFAVKVTKDIPGMPGLFLACIFATTLSTISSGYNSLAAVVYEDFVNPLAGHKLTSTSSLVLNKILVCLFGCASIGISFACGRLGGIIMSVIGMFNATSGPTIGIFIVGILSRRVSTKATTVGFLFSTVVCLGLWISAVVEKPYAEYRLPTNSTIEGCHNHPFNLTQIPSYDAHYGRPDASYFSKISAFLYPPIGVLCVWIPAILLSHVFPPKEELYSCGRRHSLTFRCRPRKV
ncbi:hypothetical protein QR680_008295 [Steinernema hermaphroditum]|uniref:Sodium-coupled monocarboxylate transporter 1 n=1 Tax=Steinernema hermaphroditum TaxID=289476 RepID=A0AA39II95_9BILA|nr:hypothetical protein QR680_008295 [Steinernema hermaphroditum]